MSEKILEISENIAMDIEQLTNGGFYPLKTFLNKDQLDSVLTKMRLANNEVWPIPILFPILNYDVSIGDSLVLKFSGESFAKFFVEEIFEIDLEKMIFLFFGTSSVDHPGVEKMRKMGNKFMTGQIKQLVKLNQILKINSLDPQEVKAKINSLGWKKIVGFHTRNPPHSAHEFLHKESLKQTDGIFIHPVIGSKKKGDFVNEAIIRGYEHFVKVAFLKNECIMTPLLTYSRYAGPREALFTAIIRRNYGCTHFIVGRDHTGVKNFYGKYDSQKIFADFPDIGIIPIFFAEPYYCKNCKKVTTENECKCDKKFYVEISGTKIRESINNKSELSEIYIRKSLLQELQSIKNPFVV